MRKKQKSSPTSGTTGMKTSYRIRGLKTELVRDDPEGILLTPVSPVGDLAGIDAGLMTVREMRKRLDSMRSEDRY